MSKTIKTPGVYINEVNAFPNSVQEVPTAIPAFIGYTSRTEYEGK
jgi:phage tail sheath protein FI